MPTKRYAWKGRDIATLSESETREALKQALDDLHAEREWVRTELRRFTVRHDPRQPAKGPRLLH